MKPPIWETVYYDSADYWMLISFMTLEPEQQLQYFEYPPLNQNDKDYERPTKNVLLALIISLELRSFIDDFWDDENVLKKDERFHKLLENMDDTVYSYESFMESDYWIELRKAAKELLDATEVGFYPDIPKPIEFDYLQELVDPPEFWD
ncbi:MULTISPECIES: hypothetical protein [unclassified Snodgrassella]|uniref:hypothetical protein n=1 Tax=unclassified Snodgrassella TaxID=2625236 RepID=UPI0018DD301C|nr:MULTISPECIES: hypothetical protein [unclassified Snodgrassella]MBI0068879.1 hypothetical protein [Snodgrassella sp. M0110]MBI0077384.1 hypothetical protein [Snodgrassella sp. M0118]MBI0079813.1 hypothetical protein [Snodgrassella sp. M0112]